MTAVNNVHTSIYMYLDCIVRLKQRIIRTTINNKITTIAVTVIAAIAPVLKSSSAVAIYNYRNNHYSYITT